MDSRLVEEIEAALPSAETARVNPDSSPTDTACAKCLEKDLLLQRCLESLRWIPIDQSAPNKFIGLLKDGGWGVFHKPKEPEDFQKMIDVYGIVGWMIPPTIAGEW